MFTPRLEMWRSEADLYLHSGIYGGLAGEPRGTGSHIISSSSARCAIKCSAPPHVNLPPWKKEHNNCGISTKPLRPLLLCRRSATSWPNHPEGLNNTPKMDFVHISHTHGCSGSTAGSLNTSQGQGGLGGWGGGVLRGVPVREAC